MARSTFRASYKGIGEMINAPWMVAEMRRRAENVKARAAATAPVQTGRYKASLQIEFGIRGGRNNDRAYARVFTDVPYGLVVEKGTSTRAGHHTLARALEAANDA